MKVVYRGPCEELYGREITVPDHDCREHAQWKRESHIETHGLEGGPYETWTEEFLQCRVCDRTWESEAELALDCGGEWDEGEWAMERRGS